MTTRTHMLVVAVAALALGCDWLGCEEPVVAAPSREVPIPLVAPPTSPKALSFDPAVDAGSSRDAGAQEDGGRQPAITVHFQLTHAGQRMPGVGFGVEDVRQRREGRLTDVMGVATLELAPGSWKITQPRGADPRHVRVEKPDDWVEVEFPPPPPAPLIEGWVVDERGSPVVGARVSFKTVEGLGSFRWNDSRVVLTGAEGRFSIAQPEHGWCQRGDGGVYEDVTGCHVGTLTAEQGRLRSLARLMSDSARSVKLVVSTLVPVTIRLVGPPGEVCWISADVGDPCPVPPTLEFPWRREYRFHLPRGPVVFRACLKGDPPTAGRLERDLRDEPWNSEHELQLRELEPVRGVVVDADGGTLAGVEVGIATYLDLLDRDLLGPISHGDVVSTVTDANGRFHFGLSESGGGRSRMELFGAWQLDHVVFTQVGDPPLTLTAVPRLAR